MGISHPRECHRVRLHGAPRHHGRSRRVRLKLLLHDLERLCGISSIFHCLPCTRLTSMCLLSQPRDLGC